MKWIGQHIFDLKSRFRNDVTIDGDLTVSGTYTQIDTDVTTTEQWLVTNDGTGPAAIINQKGSQDIFDVQDDGTSVFYIEDGGKVGIGTTSPSSPLTVAGRVDFQNDLRLRGTDSASNQGVTRFYVDSNNKFYIDTANDGSNLFAIDSSGNVGIGTVTP